jgi:hypothetical protein
MLQIASQLQASSDDYNLISSVKHLNLTSPSERVDSTANLTASSMPEPSVACIFPSYFSHFGVLILISISVVTQLSHITKILLMVIVTGKGAGSLPFRTNCRAANYSTYKFIMND